MKKKNYEILQNITRNTMLEWKNSKYIAPIKVTEKMEKAMLNWIIEFTDALKIWIDKGEEMTDGELILARTNIGAIVESWLKFFYCVFYTDYVKNPYIKNNKMIEPNELKFEILKQFSIGILFEDTNDKMYLWVEKIQHMRNSIHIFNYRDIGTSKDFINDVDSLLEFVEKIISHLPPVEDYIETLPTGYVLNPYFE